MSNRKGIILLTEYKAGEGLKKALELPRHEILNELKKSGLRGRGGAGFPIATKWMLTAAAKSDEKFLICNADEGEPGTFKDKVLLNEYAALVLEGMVIGGYVIGAKTGILYLRGEYFYLLEHLHAHLEKMRKENLLGKNILGKNIDFDIHIFLGAGAYVCGEETALIESLEGRRGEARNRPPFPVSKGFFGKPTAVNNVETLATVPRIILTGGENYAKYGTEKTKGTKLISVSGDCEKPGVYEVEWGVSIKEIANLVQAKNPKAAQIGGASGVCVPANEFGRKLAFEDLATGGSVIFFGSERKMLDVLENFMEFFTEESCGQCTPCRIGNVKLLEAVRKIKENKLSEKELSKLFELAETMKLASKCGLGQSSPNPFVSILKNFGEEIFNQKSAAEV
jgi:[NiFe] hydrogenase diaphorase moiety large subunit